VHAPHNPGFDEQVCSILFFHTSCAILTTGSLSENIKKNIKTHKIVNNMLNSTKLIRKPTLAPIHEVKEDLSFAPDRLKNQACVQQTQLATIQEVITKQSKCN